MNLPISPETTTAEDRRQLWLDREMSGMGDETDWEYGAELQDILTSQFRVIEVILGKETAAPHFLEMLPCHNVRSDNWEVILDEYWPASWLETEGGRLIDSAGIYGLYGVTPADVPLDARQQWIASLATRLEEFRRLALSDSQGVIARIVNLALSRHAIDTGEGEVDLQSLALFGGVTEGRIRNILSNGDGGLEKIGQRVTATSAATWLKGRKEFFTSIWQQQDETVPEAPSLDFSDDVLFVPVAADGSYFHAGLARGGKFMIGAKGEEVQHPSFDDALSALQKMATPRWRRPNAAGNWGIVSGRDWKRMERRQLMSMWSGV